jgi:hypothetical protein
MAQVDVGEEHSDSVSQSDDLDIVPELRECDRSRRKVHAEARQSYAAYTTQLEELERMCGSSLISDDPAAPSHPDPTLPHRTTAPELIAFAPEEHFDSAGSGNEPLSDASRSDSSEGFHPPRSPKRPVYRQPFTELNLSRTKYIDYLERFGESKSKEAEKLIGRLLDHRNKALEVQKRLTEFEDLKIQNAALAAENEQLREQYNDIQNKVTHYVIRHREMKAEVKTKQLHRLAAIRRDIETHDIEFYGFVLSQLKQHIDGKYGVDEESVRKVVTRVATTLRSASRMMEGSMSSLSPRSPRGYRATFG